MNHNFSFLGGEMLSKMGASWFVSFAYYENIDKKHSNWELVKTFPNRISVYRSSRSYHKEWLKEILRMSDNRLSTNTISLSPAEIKTMAKLILDKKS